MIKIVVISFTVELSIKKNYEQAIQLKDLSSILLKDISFKEMEKKYIKFWEQYFKEMCAFVSAQWIQV